MDKEITIIGLPPALVEYPIAGATAVLSCLVEKGFKASNQMHLGGSPNLEPEKDPEKERKLDNKSQLDDFVKLKVQAHEFIKTHGTKSGKPTWKSGNGKDARYYQKSNEGWELEVYDKNGKHIGVLKSDGIFHPELMVRGRFIDVK